MGLLDAFKQYLSDAMPGGLLNPETKPVADRVRYASGLLDPQSQVSQDAQAWHQRTQAGLADQLAGRQTPAAEQAYQTMMSMAGVAPVGMTAWHGSPHKFDKFSLDKIGTGEGAQAYGHGIYTGELKATGESYRDALAKDIRNTVNDFVASAPNTMSRSQVSEALAKHPELGGVLAERPGFASDVHAVISGRNADGTVTNSAMQAFRAMDKYMEKPQGYLYKTDIPDEAVARMLDWDKPLSQQAPEVQAAIGLDKNPNASIKDMTGLEFYVGTGGKLGEPTSASKAAAEHLRKKGIVGIRYLDGGSRSAGQGSSNFVAFDPEMIRILERNGIATGLQPWQPGEWQGLLK